ncbi:MAG: hypothetical protein E6Q88_04225 [Lysobacteraceae bacterium]|nr:MAG: hypothetical protein E6Q88_04225 [Xanthomonadaceae bacterium]
MRRSFSMGVAAAVFAVGMGASGAAYASWPEPSAQCDSGNVGEYQTTVYHHPGGYYTDYATYECVWGGQWYLVDVTRCNAWMCVQL